MPMPFTEHSWVEAQRPVWAPETPERILTNKAYQGIGGQAAIIEEIKDIRDRLAQVQQRRQEAATDPDLLASPKNQALRRIEAEQFGITLTPTAAAEISETALQQQLQINIGLLRGAIQYTRDNIAERAVIRSQLSTPLTCPVWGRGGCLPVLRKLEGAQQ